MILDAWGWCTGVTQRDSMGREEGGGFRMGNTCIPVADSCWCMAKPIQKKKKEAEPIFSLQDLVLCITPSTFFFWPRFANHTIFPSHTVLFCSDCYIRSSVSSVSTLPGQKSVDLSVRALGRAFPIKKKNIYIYTASNPSQHQSLFQWVNSLHEVAKVLEFQL